MLFPVWQDVSVWYFLGLFSSLLWLIPSMLMEFIKKSIPLRLTILISWLGGNTVLSIIFLRLQKIPGTDNFFRDYECVGRIVRYALMVFGNIGLYYYSEKSIACMLTFLFLGLYCLCTHFYIQPSTDFGVLDFFLSASLTQALSMFGLHIYTWLVVTAVVVLAILHNQLERELSQLRKLQELILSKTTPGQKISLLTGEVVVKFNEYKKKHDDWPDTEELETWDAEFVKVNRPVLFGLALAAHYLNIKSLLDLTCQTVADMIKGKNPEEIRITLGVKKDFTPEEEEEVRRKNQWAFE